MRAAELIIHTIPTLKPSDSCSQSLKIMNDYNLTQLPVVNGLQFLGLVFEEELLNIGEPESAIGSQKLRLITPHIHDHEHVFEVLKVATNLKLRIIPVIDKDNNYIGCITSDSLLSYMATRTDICEPGGIIELDMPVNDYSLSDVSRHVESNQAKVLCAFAYTNNQENGIRLTIKINTPNVQAIIQTLERHKYKITDSYQEPEFYNDLKDRYDALMNYLNV